MAILTSVRWYHTAVLICISLRLVMLNIFSYAHWPFVNSLFFLTKVYSKELYCTIVVMLPESFMPGRATTLEQQMITLHREIVSRA